MSRSYKHSPICTDYTRKHTKFAKRQANIRVRRSRGLYNGGNYKKLYCSWDIHDYCSYWTKNKAINYYEHEVYFFDGKCIFAYDREEFPTAKKFIDKHWKKYYYRK